MPGAPRVVTLCVIAVTAASGSIGSYFSGLFAFFPVAMASFFVILHTRLGGPATASVAAHVQAPLIGLGLGLLAVHLLAEPIGVWWSICNRLERGDFVERAAVGGAALSAHDPATDTSRALIYVVDAAPQRMRCS